MGYLEDLVKSFALCSGFSPLKWDGLCRGYGGAVVTRFTSELSGEPALGNEFFVEVRASISRGGRQCWSPEFGRALELNRHGPHFAPVAKLQLIAALLNCGWKGSVTIEAPAGSFVLIGGLKAGCEGRVELTSDDDQVEILSDGISRQWARTDCGIQAERGAQNWRLNKPEHSLILLGGYDVDSQVLEPRDVPISLTEWPTAGNSADAALQLLRYVDPRTFEWVTSSIRQLSLVGRRTDGMFVSRGSYLRPGNVVVSCPRDPMRLAEALVHEASHQYFFLIERLCGFVKPEMLDKLFYSGINGRQRPLSRVVLALHALVNIFAFLDRAIEKDVKLEADALQIMRQHYAASTALAQVAGDNMSGILPDAQSFVSETVLTISRILEKYAAHICNNAKVEAIANL